MTDSPLPVALLRVADQYGRPVAYPANRLASLFAEIAGTKTLTSHAIKKMRAIGEVAGFTIEYKPMPIAIEEV